MGLDENLGKVFEKVGTQIEIVGSLPSVKEYIDTAQNTQVSNPFIREHFIEGTFKAKTKIKAGDILRFVKSNLFYLVVNFSGENFRNDLVCINATLYKCNAQVIIQRLTKGVKDPDTRERNDVWVDIASLWLPFTSSLRGSTSQLEDDQNFAQYSVASKSLYVPKYVGIKIDDRVRLPDGTLYKVTNPEDFRYDGVIVCDMEEDTRK